MKDKGIKESVNWDDILRRRLQGEVREERKQIVRHAQGGTAPLAPAQSRLWILHQLDPGNPAFNRPMTLRLTGPLNHQTLEKSLNEIVRRHESLRTVFPELNGSPVQGVLAPQGIGLEMVDLEPIPVAERERQVKRILAAETEKRFVLSEGPVIRAMLLRLERQDHVLLLLMHHIVFDGWSQGIFLRELELLYDAFSRGKNAPLPELPVQYGDFAIWQEERLAQGLLEKQLSYWKRQLNGVPSLSLATDYPRPKNLSYRAGKTSLLLAPEIAGSMKELSRREQATLFMALLAALQVLLSRYARAEDVPVGVPVAGRVRAETEKLIGCFMNVLVLRTDLSGEPTFRELVGRVREVALQAYANQEVPFEKIVEELRPERDLHRWPLFQVMLNFRNLPKAQVVEAGGVRIEPFPFDPGFIGGLDLSVEITELAEGLHCSFSYDSELFRADTIERMAGHFRTLVQSAVANPDQSIAILLLLTEAERRQLIIDWTNTEGDDRQAKCAYELFEDQVR